MDDSSRTNVLVDQTLLAPSAARPVVPPAQPSKEIRDQSGQPSSSPNSGQPSLGSVRYSVFPQLRPCQTPSAPGVRAGQSADPPLKTPPASVSLETSGNRTTSPSEGLVCLPGDSPSQKRVLLESDIDAGIDIPSTICDGRPPVAGSDTAPNDEQPLSPRRLQESSSSTITKERSTQSLSTQTEAAHVPEQHATGIRPSPAFWPAKPLPASPRLSRTSSQDQAQDSAVLCTECRDENQAPGDGKEGAIKGIILDSRDSLLELKKEKVLEALPVSPKKLYNPAPRVYPHDIREDGGPFPEDVGPQDGGPYTQQPDDTSNALMPKPSTTLEHTTNRSTVSGILSTPRTVGNIPLGNEPSKVGLKNKKPGAVGFLSPSQRLHRASMMRRDRIAETERRSQGSTDSTTRSIMTPSPQVPSVKSIEEGSWNAAELHDMKSEIGSLGEDEDINDRDVLRGLMIICAASADAEFDALVRSKTGLRSRRFLADLQSFEGLNGIQ
ncbi:uncharacterized protein C8A04DRAFT_32186 [Dichotomopilus funicola]|uniref:Uncharacterized protein n=1 Tax=Dichotomopilus funicola TaxID=1934379 RepID=A0AAN6UWX9_9PEZI|nr:hypothetical protein C8A04DRAFT_32186 [Dichotomopilus funicola]